MAKTPAAQDFSKQAHNDGDGNCLSCGRDNRGHEGEPCSDECPMYWEEAGFGSPDQAEAA